jgi:hypothetical protein
MPQLHVNGSKYATELTRSALSNHSHLLYKCAESSGQVLTNDRQLMEEVNVRKAMAHRQAAEEIIKNGRLCIMVRFAVE